MSVQTRNLGNTRQTARPVKTGKPAASKRPIIVVRGSEIHGKGVFAGRSIAKGERIIEYKGTLITEAEADRLYGDDETNHTFLFLLDNDMVIDAYRGGNSARWCNKAFEDLVIKAAQTPKQADRAKLYEQAQVIFKEEAPWITVAHSIRFDPLRKEVQGYKMDATAHHYFNTADLAK